MRLIVDDHAGWDVEELRLDLSLARRTDDPTVTITYGPFADAAVDAHDWAKRMLNEQLPADARVNVTEDVRDETNDGWPVALIRNDVIGAGDSLIEARRTALYSMLQHASVAIARAPTREALERHAEAIDQFLRRAKPRWDSTPCTIESVLDVTALRGDK